MAAIFPRGVGGGWVKVLSYAAHSSSKIANYDDSSPELWDWVNPTIGRLQLEGRP